MPASLSPADGPSVSAVVLAGGRSRRFGSDKLAVDIDGHTLLSGVVGAACAISDLVVVVGPPGAALPPGVVVVREEPAFSGPFAAVAAAMEVIESDVVLVLAGDLVDPAPALPALLSALAVDLQADAAVLLDSTGHQQPLLAAYRVPALRGCLAGVDPDGRAAWALLDGLRVHEVPDSGGWSRDVDTPEDLAGENAR